LAVFRSFCKCSFCRNLRDCCILPRLPYTQDVAGSSPAPPIHLRLEKPRIYERIVLSQGPIAEARDGAVSSPVIEDRLVPESVQRWALGLQKRTRTARTPPCGGQLVRQLLTESLLLALGAGGAGLLPVVWLSPLIVVPAPAALGLTSLRPGRDGRVFAFAAGLTLSTAVVCGLAAS
jgi:hypothetical protein